MNIECYLHFRLVYIFFRMEHALLHEIQRSLAMPVYDPSKGSCCAVLELVTNKEKPNFDAEMDIVCNALQASSNLF
jgi:hypothetical protein